MRQKDGAESPNAKAGPEYLCLAAFTAVKEKKRTFPLERHGRVLSSLGRDCSSCAEKDDLHAGFITALSPF
jgi:hypothetical protein